MKFRCLGLLQFAVFVVAGQEQKQRLQHNRKDNEEKGRGLVSPRMEYDKWTPLGSGDPLKNDPTYVYFPPKVDPVHYWESPAARTPDPPLHTPPPGVLLLGVSAKKTTPKQEARKSPQVDSRRDHFDVPKYQTRVRTQYIPLNNLYMRPQRPPHTMLVPPPPGKPQLYTHTITPVQYMDTTWDAGKTQLATLASIGSTDKTVQTTPPLPPTTVSVQKEISPMVEITKAKDSIASSFLQLLLQNEMATTETPSSSTYPTTTITSQSSLTTDPLFSHYKQPAEPLRGPMYLIIQGHSKVKTYGASKLDKISGIPVQDSNDVGETRRRKSRQVEYEEFIPVDETIEAVIKDYVDDAGGEGSGIAQILTSLSS